MKCDFCFKETEEFFPQKTCQECYSELIEHEACFYDEINKECNTDFKVYEEENRREL